MALGQDLLPHACAHTRTRSMSSLRRARNFTRHLGYVAHFDMLSATAREAIELTFCIPPFKGYFVLKPGPRIV